METETIDKLFLELSQITKAKTKKELHLAKWLKNALIYVPRNGDRIQIEALLKDYE